MSRHDIKKQAIFDVVAATPLMAYPPPHPFHFVHAAHPLTVVAVQRQQKVSCYVRSFPCGASHLLAGVGAILRWQRANDLEGDLRLPEPDFLGRNWGYTDYP